MQTPTNLPNTQGTRDLLAVPGTVSGNPTGGFTFTGGATRLYSAMVVRKSIDLYIRTGIIMSRGMTITKLLNAATNFTGVKYSSGKKAQALVDLTEWIAEAKKHVEIGAEPEGAV